MSNRNIHQDRDTADVSAHAARIGVFDRAVTSPVAAVIEDEEKAMVERVLSRMNLDERAVLLRWVREERADAKAEQRRKIFAFIGSILAWMLFPECRWSRVWGLIYCLDIDSLIRGRPMAVVARGLGIERATISNAARDAAEIFNLPPSRWMRSEQTVKRNQQARKDKCA